MNTENNPLLTISELPEFSGIRPDHVEPALDVLLTQNRERIAALLADESATGWDSFVAAMEELDERLHRMWSPVSHLNSVMDSDALREVYDRCLPRLTEYATEVAQNPQLYQRYRQLLHSDEFEKLDTAQRQLVHNVVRDFRLGGAELEGEKQTRFAEVEKQLAVLKNQFAKNVLDATQAWHIDITDEAGLSGLPESSLSLARQTAEQASARGWRFTLDAPSYLAVVTYAHNRELRKQVYSAYVTRASDEGPNAGKHDNASLMLDITRLRHEKAQLLGYTNYAELSLVRKMAQQVDEVENFLRDLAARSRDVAQQEHEELKAFAVAEGLEGAMQSWDIAYYSEKLRQQQYAISQEALRPYFPVSKVLDGMFELIHRLYGIRVEADNSVDVWHKDVSFYRLFDSAGAQRGAFYLDPYARNHKRGGAWMDECVSRKRQTGSIQQPVAYLTCNFSPPVGEQPSLLTHDEVTTLFHEFGHGLHHMLTKVDYVSVSGINGVEWDAVELPSQFMENWCWQKEVVDGLSAHYQTGEQLPDAMFEKMLAAKNFQSGIQMVRQLEFALFDLILHDSFGRWSDIQQVLDAVRQDVAVIIPPRFNRFQNGFTHIFAGGYAAGYYSYKWAEVLSADAFSKFEENGLFDPATGQAFLTEVLEQGGSRPAMELFESFRGRKPGINALLRHSGLAV